MLGPKLSPTLYQKHPAVLDEARLENWCEDRSVQTMTAIQSTSLGLMKEIDRIHSLVNLVFSFTSAKSEVTLNVHAFCVGGASHRQDLSTNVCLILSSV